MSSEKTILDPYGEPDDIAAAELKIVRDVRPGTGWRLARVVLLLSIALAAGFAYTMLRKSEADTHLADAARASNAASDRRYEQQTEVGTDATSGNTSPPLKTDCT